MDGCFYYSNVIFVFTFFDAELSLSSANFLEGVASRWVKPHYCMVVYSKELKVWAKYIKAIKSFTWIFKQEFQSG